MITVHKPMVIDMGSTSPAHQVNFKITMSDDIICSFAFNDSCGTMINCSRNYLLVTQGEDELYNLYGLGNDTLQTIIGLACLDSWIALQAVLESLS